MRINHKSIIGFILLSLSFFAYADSEKDSQIHQMLTNMDQAIENKDAATLGRYLDENIHIVMHLTMAGEKQVHKFNKTEYLDLLQDGWDVTEEYTYTRDEVDIQYIGKGNKAVVTAKVYELSVVKGQPMAALSQEKAVIEFRDDGPVTISLTAVTDVKM